MKISNLNNLRLLLMFSIIFIFTMISHGRENVSTENLVSSILQRVRLYPFRDTKSGYTGVADIGDTSWTVRVLAIRDLARLGNEAIPFILMNLEDSNPNVRHVCTYVLGLLKSPDAQERLVTVVRNDPDPVVRCQAALALGEIGRPESKSILEGVAKSDSNHNVRHRAELALGKFENETNNEKGTSDFLEAYRNLNEKAFNVLSAGKPAPDFELKNTKGNSWKLSDYRSKKAVVLIWIFADWCPVCQREFHDLIEIGNNFREAEVTVATVECHDLYRCRAMVAGQDIWWSHLVDNAGSVGAMYGVAPQEFVVHDEWINRPATIIIDKEGIVRFAYYGTFWGDRPTIEQTLKMIKTENFAFEHPERRK